MRDISRGHAEARKMTLLEFRLPPSVMSLEVARNKFLAALLSFAAQFALGIFHCALGLCGTFHVPLLDSLRKVIP
jgi:hypothetical protein